MKNLLCIGLFIFSAVDGMRLREAEEPAELFTVKDHTNPEDVNKATLDAIKEIRKIFQEVHDPKGLIKFDDKHLLAMSQLDMNGFKKQMGGMFDRLVHHKREQGSESKKESSAESSAESGDWFDHNSLRTAAEANKKVNWANLDCTCPAFFSAQAWTEGGHYFNQVDGGTRQARHCDDRPATPYTTPATAAGPNFDKHTSRPKFKRWHAKAKAIWNKREEGGRMDTRIYYLICPKCPPQGTANTGAAFVRKMARTGRAASDDYVADAKVDDWKKQLVSLFNSMPFNADGSINIFAVLYNMAPEWESEAAKAPEAANLGIGDTVYNSRRLPLPVMAPPIGPVGAAAIAASGLR